MLKVRVVLLLPENGSIAVKAGYPPEDALDPSDLAAATWAWTNDRPAGRGSDTLPGSHRLFLPLRTARGIVGVVGIDSDRSGPILTPDQRRLFDALVNQGALAIERVHLVEDVERAKRSIETERLRAALLTSLSHDLKTPLAAILGSATTIRDFSDKLDAAERADLLSTIIDESERLNRFIANLLDMTKLEAGAISAKTEVHDVGEIVDATLKRAKKILGRHTIRYNIPATALRVKADPVLFEQVLFNLLDNAAKYAPEGSMIEIDALQEFDRVTLHIRDEGPGIPADELEKIFDKFYRANKADHVRAGTGLGLPISRGFIEIMGGTITAANRHDRSGALITVTLPAPAQFETLEHAA
jgi:two-component system sensor histidine kinase KdpD